MLDIVNLHATVAGREILRGLDLHINAGEVHAIMGPNGSGKSTLAQVLAGRDTYEVTAGSITYSGAGAPAGDNQGPEPALRPSGTRGEAALGPAPSYDLLELSPEDRARAGVFLAFQYPVEIPGVSNNYFLRTALNAIRKHQGLDDLDAVDFLALVDRKMKLLHMDDTLMKRAVNEGFSGGEKKRNEIFQMAVLEPKLAILDETDSGLDIDALKTVAEGVNALRSPDRAILLVTHYQRLLNYIVPDFVHVLSNGRIVKSGGKELALELEDKGYQWLGVDDSREEEAQVSASRRGH